METSDDRQAFETATNQTHPQGPLGARKCDVLGHPPFNKKFRFEISKLHVPKSLRSWHFFFFGGGGEGVCSLPVPGVQIVGSGAK